MTNDTLSQFESHLPALMRIGHSFALRCHAAGDADEYVAEAICHAVEALNSTTAEISNLRAWLITVIRNRIRDRARQDRRRRERTEELAYDPGIESDPVADVIQDESLAELLAAIPADCKPWAEAVLADVPAGERIKMFGRHDYRFATRLRKKLPKKFAKMCEI